MESQFASPPRTKRHIFAPLIRTPLFGYNFPGSYRLTSSPPAVGQVVCARGNGEFEENFVRQTHDFFPSFWPYILRLFLSVIHTWPSRNFQELWPSKKMLQNVTVALLPFTLLPCHAVCVSCYLQRSVEDIWSQLPCLLQSPPTLAAWLPDQTECWNFFTVRSSPPPLLPPLFPPRALPPPLHNPSQTQSVRGISHVCVRPPSPLRCLYLEICCVLRLLRLDSQKKGREV